MNSHTNNIKDLRILTAQGLFNPKDDRISFLVLLNNERVIIYKYPNKS
jgi:hypothetical protein